MSLLNYTKEQLIEEINKRVRIEHYNKYLSKINLLIPELEKYKIKTEEILRTLEFNDKFESEFCTFIGDASRIAYLIENDMEL